MRQSTWQSIKLVFHKEITAGMRFKAAWAAMFMFALTTLACVSMAMQGGTAEPRLLAALLWVILFFASMAGADRVFVDEDTAGTLLALRIYGSAQAVLMGKMLYTFFLMSVLTVFITPLYFMLMDVPVSDLLALALTLGLGCWGIAAAGTLIASLTTGASVHSGLFSILMLPVMLPVFLPAIYLTAGAFGSGEVSLSYLGGMGLYDLILTVGASVLFDYLWYED